MRIRTVLVSMLLSAAIAPAIPAAAQAVLLLPFENRTSSSALDWVGESAAQGIAARWRSPERYAIRREERLAALDQLGLPPALSVSHATVIKIGEATGADYVITGSFEGDEQRLTLTARVIEMKQPRMDPLCTESGALADLLNVQDKLAIALAKSAGLTTASTVVHGPGTESREAWENYIRGLLAGSPPQQAKFFREAARLDPSFKLAAFQLGRILFRAQDYSGAFLWLSKLAVSDPNYLEAGFLIGIAAYHQHEWERAEAAFRSVTDILPLNEAYNNLGVAQSRQRKRAAVENLQKAVEGDSNDPDYSFNLGSYYLRVGDYPQAAKRFREALVKKPGDAEARALLNNAISEQATPDPPERLKYNFEEPTFRELRMTLERAAEDKLEAMPEQEHAASHIQRGKEFFDRGDDTSAIEEFREAVKVSPGNAPAFVYLARLYLRGGRVDEAVEAARRAAELNKKDPAPLLLLARILADQGKTGEALERVREALDREPGNVAAREMERMIKEKP